MLSLDAAVDCHREVLRLKCLGARRERHLAQTHGVVENMSH